MPSPIDDLLEDAVEKLQGAANELRRTIAQKEADFRRDVDPLRQQLADLEAAISRLQGDDAPPPRSDRVPRGHNRRAILDVLASNPNLTAAEVAEATGISKATTHATLAKLTSDGKVVKRPTDRGVEHALTASS